MGQGQSKIPPALLASLNKSTHFDRKEISTWYGGFVKQAGQASPNSTAISLDHFVALYGRFFPFGNPQAFAKLVFRRFDANESGAIEFDEYLQQLSVLSRGHIDEKLRWTFDFYDLDGDGLISRAELAVVVHAIFQMIGSREDPGERVALIMSRLDSNDSGSISWDAFQEAARDSDVGLLQGLLLYDGII